jgi:ferredoxin
MAKYRIVIDRDLCVGDKQCWDKAPDTFEIDDNDKAFVKDPEGNWPEYVRAAAEGCPIEAISIYDVETGERVWPTEDKKKV